MHCNKMFIEKSEFSNNNFFYILKKYTIEYDNIQHGIYRIYVYNEEKFYKIIIQLNDYCDLKIYNKQTRTRNCLRL